MLIHYSSQILLKALSLLISFRAINRMVSAFIFLLNKGEGFEPISKILTGNRFHATLRTDSPTTLQFFLMI